MVERDTTTSSGNSAPLIGIILIAVVVAIGLYLWHPWNSVTPGQSTTSSQTNSQTTTTQGAGGGANTSGGSTSSGTSPTKP